jgi:streptogramin lyase
VPPAPAREETPQPAPAGQPAAPPHEAPPQPAPASEAAPPSAREAPPHAAPAGEAAPTPAREAPHPAPAGDPSSSGPAGAGVPPRDPAGGSAPGILRRRGRLFAALAGVIVAAAVAAILLLSQEELSPLEATRLTVDPIPVGANPLGLVAVDGTPWVLTSTDEAGAVRPIEDGKAGPELALDDEAYSLAGSGTDLLAMTYGGLARVDVAAREVVGGPVNLDAGSDSGIAVGEGALWVTDIIDGAVIRADPETGRPVGEPIPIGDNLRGPIAAAEGAVWVLSADATDDVLTVTPIDPATNRPGQAINVGAYGSVYGLAAGAGGVWVIDDDTKSLRRIDPVKRELDPRRVTLEEGFASVAVGSGAVWTLDGQGLTVLRIDPATVKRVGQPVAVAAGSESRLAVSPGAAWVLSRGDDAALRITWDD